MKRLSILFLVSLAALSLHAASIGIGDPAPDLKISKWVKGDAISNLDPNKTYVVEFWATWCGPCKVSIPHLTELAHQFTNVTFIGVDAFEHSAHKDALVSEFVTKMGDNMDYRVGMDTEDQFMADNWMKAADQNGIPTAFLIQQGKIVWIGHPMGLETPLTEVTAGTFDIEKAKQSALAQAKFQGALRDYQKAIAAGSDDAEISTLEAAARAVAPQGADFDAIKKQVLEQAELAKVSAIFAKYKTAVGEHGDPAQAAALASQIQNLKITSAAALNEIAWAILTDEKIKQRDLGLATALAKEGVEASDSKEPAVLDTYARALFDSGKLADAIDTQKKAVAAAQDETMKSDLQATLDKYQASADKPK